VIRARHTGLVTDAGYAAEVLASPLPVLLEFTADRCPPCRQLAPVLTAIARDEGHRLKVVQMDADSNPVTMARHRVLSLPTLILFSGGEARATMVGARTGRKLLAEMAEALGPDW
jgi:thioredoxin 1